MTSYIKTQQNVIQGIINSDNNDAHINITTPSIVNTLNKFNNNNAIDNTQVQINFYFL